MERKTRDPSNEGTIKILFKNIIFSSYLENENSRAKEADNKEEVTNGTFVCFLLKTLFFLHTNLSFPPHPTPPHSPQNHPPNTSHKG